MILSYFIFWFPWLPFFGLYIINVLKWGPLPNFHQFKNHNNYIFSDLKCIMMVKEIPRNGVTWCLEIAPNDL